MWRTAFIALLATAIFQLPAQSQMRGAVVGSGRDFAPAQISSGVHSSFSGRSGGHHFYTPILLGAPYYYADYETPPAVSPIPPQIVVVQVPAQSAAEAPKESFIEPLLIEWQDGRFVRVEDSHSSNAETKRDGHDGVKPMRSSQRWDDSRPVANAALPPVQLVYRDGHRERVGEYTIAGSILYARGDYWTDGYWTKKIPLTSLDLAATKVASREQGASFLLPSLPDEVVMRP